MTLGGWLGGSIAWHFAAMWLLVANGLFYLGYGAASAISAAACCRCARDVVTDAASAMRFRLPHHPACTTAVQKLLYWAVMLLGILVVLSGLALWKPVQLDRWPISSAASTSRARCISPRWRVSPRSWWCIWRWSPSYPRPSPMLVGRGHTEGNVQ
jgi:hypothetical protein